MPRSSGRSGGGRPSAPSRPAPAPAPQRAPQQQQQRPMSSVPATRQQAPPPAQAQAPASGGSGLFGQMASTAAGVAVGSSIGHAIGGFFGGGSSAQQAPPAPEYQQPVGESYAQPGQAVDNYSSNYNSGAMSGQYSANSSAAAEAANGPCAGDVKTFTDCMYANRGDMNACSYYFEMMKACTQATRQ